MRSPCPLVPVLRWPYRPSIRPRPEPPVTQSRNRHACRGGRQGRGIGRRERNRELGRNRSRAEVEDVDACDWSARLAPFSATGTACVELMSAVVVVLVVDAVVAFTVPPGKGVAEEFSGTVIDVVAAVVGRACPLVAAAAGAAVVCDAAELSFFVSGDGGVTSATVPETWEIADDSAVVDSPGPAARLRCYGIATCRCVQSLSRFPRGARRPDVRRRLIGLGGGFGR